VVEKNFGGEEGDKRRGENLDPRLGLDGKRPDIDLGKSGFSIGPMDEGAVVVRISGIRVKQRMDGTAGRQQEGQGQHQRTRERAADRPPGGRSQHSAEL
jgi:hypothetical protein